MTNIGSFGAAKKEADKALHPDREPDTLTYYGENIRITGEIGMAPLMDFASAAAEGTDSTDMNGLAAIKSMLKDSIDPRDWDLFWRLTRENKAGPEVLLEIVRVVMEAVTARPTGGPSGSSPGPSPSSQPSNTFSPILESPRVVTPDGSTVSAPASYATSSTPT